MAGGRIALNVPETDVQRYQDSPFFSARGENFLVRPPAQPLLQNRSHFVACGAQQRSGVAREVLVELEPQRHARRLSGDRNDALAREVRGVSERGRNVLRLERRIVGKDALHILTRGQIV
jgi:hypothetical protein